MRVLTQLASALRPPQPCRLRRPSGPAMRTTTMPKVCTPATTVPTAPGIAPRTPPLPHVTKSHFFFFVSHRCAWEGGEVVQPDARMRCSDCSHPHHHVGHRCDPLHVTRTPSLAARSRVGPSWLLVSFHLFCFFLWFGSAHLCTPQFDKRCNPLEPISPCVGGRACRGAGQRSRRRGERRINHSITRAVNSQCCL